MERVNWVNGLKAFSPDARMLLAQGVVLRQYDAGSPRSSRSLKGCWNDGWFHRCFMKCLFWISGFLVVFGKNSLGWWWWWCSRERKGKRTSGIRIKEVVIVEEQEGGLHIGPIHVSDCRWIQVLEVLLTDVLRKFSWEPACKVARWTWCPGMGHGAFVCGMPTFSNDWFESRKQNESKMLHATWKARINWTCQAAARFMDAIQQGPMNLRCMIFCRAEASQFKWGWELDMRCFSLLVDGFCCSGDLEKA